MRKIRPLMRLMWIFLCLAGTIGIILVILKKIEIYHVIIIIPIYACASVFWAIDNAIGRDDKLEKMSKEEREREMLKLEKEFEAYSRSKRENEKVNCVFIIIVCIIIIIHTILNP